MKDLKTWVVVSMKIIMFFLLFIILNQVFRAIGLTTLSYTDINTSLDFGSTIEASIKTFSLFFSLFFSIRIFQDNQKEIGLGKYIGFLFLSSLWFISKGMPNFPIGLLIVLVFFRPRTWKYYLPITLATVIGFMGTGMELSYASMNNTMMNNEKNYNSTHLNFGFRLGIETWEKLKNENKMVIYRNKQMNPKIDEVKEVMKKFVPTYNDSNSTFLMESLFRISKISKMKKAKIDNFLLQTKKMYGNIVSYSYFGYATYNKKSSFYVVYEIKTDKKEKRYMRLFFKLKPNNDISFIRFEFLHKDVKFRIKNIL